jgi:small subunit ribosomal protein S7
MEHARYRGGGPRLQRYLTLKPVVIPQTGGRHEHKRFMKSSINVVERLTNNMMRHGRAGGKKAKTTGVVRNALDIVHLKTGKNPLEVLLQAIQNSAPCEGTTRVSYGGIVYHQAVDIAPQRRVDQAVLHPPYSIVAGQRRVLGHGPRPVPGSKLLAGGTLPGLPSPGNKSR